MIERSRVHKKLRVASEDDTRLAFRSGGSENDFKPLSSFGSEFVRTKRRENDEPRRLRARGDRLEARLRVFLFRLKDCVCVTDGDDDSNDEVKSRVPCQHVKMIRYDGDDVGELPSWHG